MVAVAREALPLDLHKGIGDSPDERPTVCERWPEDFRLRSTLGELVRGRCKATNLCDYCARLAAIENTELLWLDAMHGVAPVVWCVLTTGTDSLDPSLFYDARKHLAKAVRRAVPAARREYIEWCALVEFTRGYSTWSGGRRFPHWNLLWKGLEADDVALLVEVIERVWCGRSEFKARPEAQHVGTINEAGGLVKYLALHFQKESQSPPQGWRGHRFLKSRGYLWLPTPEARYEARQSLLLKRCEWHARKAGLTGAALIEAAEVARYEANELAWNLVRLQQLPTAFGEDGMPSDWATFEVEV